MRKDQDGMLPKSGRNRALNVIYFIDAHKTRSFHLSLTKFIIVLGVLFFLISWSFVSMFFVARSIEKKDVLNDRLHAALATIFEYQSRYDGVYEIAYPEVEVKKKEVATAVDKPTGKAPDETSKANEKANIEFEEQDLNSIAAENLKVKASNPEWPISIEDLSIHRDQDELELSFAIRNTHSPARSEGYIWAVATLLNRNGELSYLGSPRGLKVDKDGPLNEPSKHANWYSIRYYKAKSFYFTLPPKWSGNITQFDIGMLDTSGKQSTFTVPLIEASGRKTGQASEQSRQGRSSSESKAGGKVASKSKNNKTENN